MKTASAALQAHLQQPLTTLAVCWKATLTNGTVYGFTNHSRDLVIDGVTYKANAGHTPSDIENSAGLAVDGLDVQGLLSDASITEADLMAGRWDHAEIRVFLVNWADLSQGTLKLARGRLGEVTLGRSSFVSELRGLTQAYATQVGEMYSPTCRAALGDARCKVSLASYTVTGTVAAVTSRTTFTDTGRAEASDHFNYGQVTWTGGANAGLKMEVKDWDLATKTFTLFLPMPYDIAPGDTYSVHAGCDRRFGTCVNTFANAVNFRGEPHVPGAGKLLLFGGQA